MEDLFKILVWLIIIISFFSSFFKKKKQTPQKKKEPDNNFGNQSVDFPKEKTLPQESYGKNDILKEIEKLFKVEPPVTTETKQREHYDTQWHEKTTSEHERTESEHTMETNWDAEKKKIKAKKVRVTSKVEEEAKRFERFLNEEEKFDQLSFKTIKQRLKHPESLKEFIVISEILEKPAWRSNRIKAAGRFNRFS